MSTSDLYPLFLELNDRRVLVVGGGSVATRRVLRLLACGARVTVVSPSITDGLRALTDSGALEWYERRFHDADADGCTLVLVAVDDVDEADRIAAVARTAGALVNVAADKDSSDFHVPALVESPPLRAALSTNGLSPATAARARETLERLFSSPAGTELASDAAGGRSAQPGSVYLVGAGPGRLDLLTVRALTLLRTADVVYYDRLVGDDILRAIPPTTERVYVGKRVGCPTRADIETLIVESAKAGRAVVRLKGGDPMMFGRGGDEMLALRRAGIPFEIVPGISALNGVPAGAHIPLTFRGVAHEVVVRSGHPMPTATPAPPFSSTNRRSETTFIYFMGVGRLAEIVEELRADGVANETPAAIIENGQRPEQRVVTAPLDEIADAASEASVEPPSLLVVGEVVAFRELDALVASLAETVSPSLGGE